VRYHRSGGGITVACGRPAGRCRICELVDPAHPDFDAYYRSFYGESVEGDALPPSRPSIPLAGDIIEAATRRLGVDRLARWLADKLGVDCGCDDRRRALNRIDAQLRRYLSR
jgi:hypothetical protein